MEEQTIIRSNGIEDYFLDSLQEGRKDEIRICFMAHNSAWPHYQILADHFDNLIVDFFGSGTAYLDMFRKEVKDDYDVIILDGNSCFDELEEFRLAEMAQAIAKNKRKKVSFGYAFYIPDEDNKQCSHREALVYTYANGKKVGRRLIGEDKDTLFWFFDIVMEIHDHFQPSKVLNKNNNILNAV